MSPISNTTQIHRPVRTQVEISESEDADEFLEDAYGVKLRLRRGTAERREGALLSFARTTVGPLTIDDVYLAGQLEAEPGAMGKVVGLWATAGRVSGECEGLTGEASAGEIALLSQPDLPHRVDSEDLRVTSVLLDLDMVAGVAAGLPGGHAPRSVRFSSFQPIDVAAAQLWKETVRYVKHSVLAEQAIVTPLVLGHASRLLAAVTLTTFPNTATAAPTPHDRAETKPVILRRAIEYIDANVANDIGLADVAKAVHVTPRAVQYMFRRHLETTPLQYLRRLRLHYAHQDLVAADPAHETVTEVAARWGFAHAGRFALLYRVEYGRSPHTTLRA